MNSCSRQYTGHQVVAMLTSATETTESSGAQALRLTQHRTRYVDRDQTNSISATVITPFGVAILSDRQA